jgi:8-hydroxy-5-deazaflavin:NADPH oxidoreductase
MNISVIGRGNVGGGLAKLWRAAGHEVQEIGKDGGDVSSAEVLLVAVPSGAIKDAFGKLTGAEGKTTIDATNAFGGRDESFPSLAAEVKSLVNGPVANSFNLNFAALHDQIADQKSRPGNIYTADDEAREVTEQLIRDAGYEPLYAGGLENARAQEDFLPVFFGITQGGMGPTFYRFAKPGEL